MAVITAIAGAAAAIAGLILYLYRRHDSPASRRERCDDEAKKMLAEFDKALSGKDAETITRLFSGLDDSPLFDGMRSKDGDSPVGPGDKAAP